METKHKKPSETVQRKKDVGEEAVNLESDFEDDFGGSEDEDEKVAFEKEVGETVNYGDCLGVRLEGFDNHVRKMVHGELEASRSL